MTEDLGLFPAINEIGRACQARLTAELRVTMTMVSTIIDECAAI